MLKETYFERVFYIADRENHFSTMPNSMDIDFVHKGVWCSLSGNDIIDINHLKGFLTEHD